MVPRDADDDNFNTFDPYPAGPLRRGEVGDCDFYDESGGLVLPVEWMRRFVTPVDVDGSGQVVRWNQWDNVLGPDRFGRVGFFGYFRPPGSPGSCLPMGPSPRGRRGPPRPTSRTTSITDSSRYASPG